MIGFLESDSAEGENTVAAASAAADFIDLRTVSPTFVFSAFPFLDSSLLFHLFTGRYGNAFSPNGSGGRRNNSYKQGCRHFYHFLPRTSTTQPHDPEICFDSLCAVAP